MKNTLNILAAKSARTKDDLDMLATGLDIEAAAATPAGEKPTPRRFKMVAYTGGPMRLGWFEYPVVVDLAGMDVGNEQRPILVDHQSDIECLMGQTDKITKSAKQLTVEGSIYAVGEKAQMAVALADQGFKFQASIGARATQMEFVQAGASAQANGKTWKGPVYIARRSALGEVSFVALGADENTSASIAAHAAESESAMTFEQWLKASGLTLDGLNDVQAAAYRVAYDAQIKAGVIKVADEPKPDTAPTSTPIQASGTQPDPVADMRAKAAAEATRIAAVEAAAKDFPEIRAKAIGEGWDATKTELEVLRASRPKAAPAGIVRDNTLTGDVLTAAACMAGGMDTARVEKQFKPDVIEAADRRYHGRISLQQMLIEAACANGYSGGPFAIRNDLRGVLAAAFNVQAGFSTISVPGILSNTANKFLLEGFMAVEQAWREIAAIRSVNDFKTVTSYRMTGDLEYEQLAPTGEIKHGTLGEDSFTNQAKTYAKMLGITRTDIINDDLGALTQAPTRLGRGAGLKLNTVFWTAFLNNASFFTAARGNYQEGANTALSITSLTAGELLFLDQTDADSKPLSIAPEILLVPNALSTLATSLTRDLEIRDTTASTKYTTSNPHAGKFRPVRSSYLSNATISGYSAAAWYLLANPAMLAAIEVCFLNGQQSPTVETADADFNTLGIQMRGYHDFGVALQEYRAGIKSKGSA